MFSLLDPGPSRGELRFQLFGVPVRIHPWFWFTTLIMGATRDPGTLMVWVAVVFVSILVHELGHVAAFRYFGVRAHVLLYGFGGLAIPDDYLRGWLARIVVPAAGPLAGFLLAIVTFACSHVLDPESALGSNRYWNTMMGDLFFVNVFWGLMNLLPVYPLDGGQVARAIFDKHDPVRGKRRSLILSAVTGAIVAGLAFFFMRSMYLVGLFGILAATSMTALDDYRPMFKPSGSRR
jgi:stage IV sporulation protein FB